VDLQPLSLLACITQTLKYRISRILYGTLLTPTSGLKEVAMEERSLENAVINDDDQPSMPTATGATSTGASSQQLVTIETPGLFDVLLGRGKKNTRHHGNEQLQTLLKTHSVRYNSTTSRNEKTAITQEIVHNVQTTSEPPGRFLKFDKDANGWMEVDDVRARIKVSHAIRYNSRYKKRKAPPAHSEPTSQEANTMARKFPPENSEPSAQEANTMGSDNSSPHREAHQQERPSDRSPLVFDESILAGLGQDAHSSNDTHDTDTSVLYDQNHQQINEDLAP
jgi:hypothetical protein